MQLHIGTKLIKSLPMNRLDWNIYRGWDLPDDEDGTDEGFLVEYVDGGKSNHPDHEGYISWSPVEVFKNAYQDVTKGVSFGSAILLLKRGEKVARKGWNGKNMWLILVGPSEPIVVSGSRYHAAGLEGHTKIGAHIDMMTANGSMQPGWLASQPDMLSNDWVIVE